MRDLRTDEKWSEGTGTLADQDGDDYFIPLTSQKGFKGRLWLEVKKLNQ